MPQVDFESLVSSCAGGNSDRKVVCETIAGDDQDWPPESIWLSGDAEYDWWDRNAVVYERKESTKGSSIFSSSTNLNPNSSNSNSQRFSKNLKSKAAIIGLPKSQKSAFADATMSRRHQHHHRPGNTTLFPKRSASVGKSIAAAVFEPSSPKVSCIGRVRSRRDRNRRLRTRQRSSSSSSAAAAAVTVTAAAVERQKSSRRGRRRTGFFESVRAIFRSRKSVQKNDLASEDSTSKKKKKNKSRKARGNSGGDSVNTVSTQNDASFEDSVSSAPPGLGSLNRFASGRRSEPWM